MLPGHENWVGCWNSQRMPSRCNQITEDELTQALEDGAIPNSFVLKHQHLIYDFRGY